MKPRDVAVLFALMAAVAILPSFALLAAAIFIGLYFVLERPVGNLVATYLRWRRKPAAPRLTKLPTNVINLHEGKKRARR
jgi:Na+/melibiose symporter-like transporter